MVRLRDKNWQKIIMQEIMKKGGDACEKIKRT